METLKMNCKILAASLSSLPKAYPADDKKFSERAYRYPKTCIKTTSEIKLDDYKN
jgi:hypothetical protein